MWELNNQLRIYKNPLKEHKNEMWKISKMEN